jgi:uncharacterized protein (DUF1697 family)
MDFAMSKYIAFLRAINVGGHTVKMEALRRLFETWGFSGVETFITSGNVIFETPESDARNLGQRIETGLKQALGYEVAAFLRTPAELAQIANYQPFPPARLETAQALNIALLAAPLDEAATQKLMALKTDIDDFQVHEREIYWLCLKKQSESTVSNAVLEKALRSQATLRGINTIRKMAEKYSQ